MKAFYVPALLVLLISCSSSNPQKSASATGSADLARTISSSADQEAMESSYARILSDADPVARLSDYFARLVSIYYRTDGLVGDYDKRLEYMSRNKSTFEGQDLITDRAYTRLMAAWILQNRQIDKIAYIYRRNYVSVMSKDKNSNDPELTRDLALKKAFMQSIRRYGQSDRVAMQNLLVHLGQVALEAHQEMQAPEAENKDAKIFEESTFKSNDEQMSHLRKNRKSTQRKSLDASRDDSIEEELLTLEPVVQAHLNEMFATREPQSAGDVVPSATGKGNLTGNTFKEGRWALTFDDGPNATHTSAILTNLEQRRMKTSFFWLSSLTPRFPTLINRAKSLEMALGNHSHSHANLPRQGAASLRREIVDSTATHRQAFGYKPTYFRCPYGACGGNGSNIRQMIANEGMVHIFWNIDSLDWQDKNPASIVNRVKRAMAVAKKGIILFHDIHPQSVEATKMLMDDWKPRLNSGDMRLLTIPQAISELNSDAGMQ